DLTRHSCIRFRFPSGITFPWRLSNQKNRSVEVQVGGSLIVNDERVAIEAAMYGAGLIQLPDAWLAPAFAAGTLVRVLDDLAPAPFDGFYLYYPSRRQIRPALKALVDFLKTQQRAGGRTRDHKMIARLA